MHTYEQCTYYCNWAAIVRPIRFAAGVLALQTGVVGSWAEPVRGRVIAVSGQQIPGRPEGVQFREVSALWSSAVSPRPLARVNAAGEFAFVATTTDHSGQELWSSRSEGLSLIAAQGAQIPGQPDGSTFGAFAVAPGTIETSTLFFTERPQGQRSGNLVWRWTSGKLDLIASPDVGLAFVALGMDGSILLARHEDGEFIGIIRRRGDEVSTVIEVGNPAPGFEPAARIQALWFGSRNPSLSRDGQFVLVADVEGDGFGPQRAIWQVHGDDQLELLARSSNELPGLPPDQIGELSSIGCDSGGNVNYHGYPYIEGSQRWMSWRLRDGSWQAWLAAGEPGPQLEAGTTLANRPVAFLSFGDGRIALAANVEGPESPAGQGKCIWVADAGEVRLIARSGRHNPFLARDAVLRIPYETWVEPIVVSPEGRLAFRGQIRPAKGRAVEACFGIDRAGRVRRILAVGDSLPSDSGITHPVASIRSIGVGGDGSAVVGVILDNDGGTLMDAIVRVAIDCPTAACDYADVAGNDCAVTLDDLAAVLANFGQAGPLLGGDADLNDRVDFADLEHVLATFGMRCDD